MLAQGRMAVVGRAPRRKLGWSIVTRVFTRWHVWALTVLYIIFINVGSSSSVNPLSLWMKANGWSVAMVVRLRLWCIKLLRSLYRNWSLTLLIAEYHSHSAICRATCLHRRPFGPLRLSAQSSYRDDCANAIWVPYLVVLGYMVNTGRSEVVRILRVPSWRSLWATRYDLGKRNLRSGR